MHWDLYFNFIIFCETKSNVRGRNQWTACKYRQSCVRSALATVGQKDPTGKKEETCLMANETIFRRCMNKIYFEVQHFPSLFFRGLNVLLICLRLLLFHLSHRTE